MTVQKSEQFTWQNGWWDSLGSLNGIDELENHIGRPEHPPRHSPVILSYFALRSTFQPRTLAKPVYLACFVISSRRHWK